MKMNPAIPLLKVENLHKAFGKTKACHDISFELWPGEVLGIVGESGSGKSTLLRLIAGLLEPDKGTISYQQNSKLITLTDLDEPALRHLQRTEWGFVHQHPSDGLRMNVSAGANIGERLMANNWRHYGNIREKAQHWLKAVEIDPARIDDLPRTFSGGMQQRVQIARNLVTNPNLVFLDEPTGGLDVSVQAKLLDLLRGLVSNLGLSAIMVTHDLAVARLLSTRLIVMKQGEIIEHGLTDQVLEDPQAAYSQLLVSSVLQV